MHAVHNHIDNFQELCMYIPSDVRTYIRDSSLILVHKLKTVIRVGLLKPRSYK